MMIILRRSQESKDGVDHVKKNIDEEACMHTVNANVSRRSSRSFSLGQKPVMCREQTYKSSTGIHSIIDVRCAKYISNSHMNLSD